MPPERMATPIVIDGRRVFDPEKSLLESDALIQVVGNPINIKITPLDRSGANLGDALPPGILDVQATTTNGVLSPISEELDEFSISNGIFTTSVVMYQPGIANINASVGGIFISDFDGSTLQPRTLQLQFVTPEAIKVPEVTEPLGDIHG